MEEWRKVPGYHYSIDITGEDYQCRNDETGKVISTVISRGRLFWNLWKDGNGHQRQIGVWIAITFPEQIENGWFEGAEIDHKDTNPMNNNPSNLKWVTHKQNINNPLTLLNKSESRKGAKHSKVTKAKISASIKEMHRKRRQKRESI